jgi:hypothetical protein
MTITENTADDADLVSIEYRKWLDELAAGTG